MKTLHAHCSIFALLCGLPGVSAAALAEAGTCEAKYKELVPIAMKMAYQEFDQSESGWRKLEDCEAESAQLLGRYIKKQESELRNVRWHLAQVLALSGDNERAAEEASKALNPDEARQHPNFKWNAYVQATVEFLRNDRAAFDAHYEAHRLATAKHPENQANLKALTGLARCFGKPYKEAYISCRNAP